MITLGRGTRWKMIFVATVGLVATGVLLFSDVNAYRQAGSQPTEMTLSQVHNVASPAAHLSARWIRLTDPVDLVCSQARVWTEDGKATMVILAFDQSKQQPLWLEYNGNHSCEELKAIPLEGLLVQPGKFWIKQGMIRPSSLDELVELRVGASPADLRGNIKTWAACELIFLAMLWVAYVTRPRKAMARHAKAF